MKKEDFNNDKKDAGEVGCGHTVTYLYEIIPNGGKVNNSVDPLKYQKAKPKPLIKSINNKEMYTLKVRYKKPEDSKSKLFVFPVDYARITNQSPGDNFKIASAAAAFAMKLKHPEEDKYIFDKILNQVVSAKGKDENGYRGELANLIKNAKSIY